MSCSKDALADTNKAPATGAAPALDTPPAYHLPTARCTTGLIDFAHLSTLTAEQLERFDGELVALCRKWLEHSLSVVPMVELRDWLRGYGFFVSNDPRKYAQRAADPQRPLGQRLEARMACEGLSPHGDGVMRRNVFWEAVRELVEVRGLGGRV